MKEFRDQTGRPGPATWELSAFPEGTDDHPVTGVSWFEAAAYSEFVGKSLPTVHHWISTASIWESAHIIPLSNFGSNGLASIGSRHGLGRFGVYDMAGNAREWCYNATGDERYVMGGCWSDPLYMFNFPEKRSPFHRSPCTGFRCMKVLGDIDLSSEAWQDIPHQHTRDYSNAKPASDDVFEAYQNVYMYDKTPLNARIELTDDDPEHWKIEKISFDAAYGNERMHVYLFLPRGTQPPYQTIVLFPGAYAQRMRSSGNGKTLNSFDFVDFVIQSGRAVLYPVYKSTYERQDGYHYTDPNTTLSEHYSHIIMWRNDVARSVDYLETRDDIDHDRIAYFGSSWGGWMAPLILGQDKRFNVAVLRLVGLPTWETNPPYDPINFMPRIVIPVLILNGRYDYLFPHETSQVPMFDWLGTVPEDKKHVVFETAHSMHGYRHEMMREVLDWLDRYLGPL
jgi:dienelactone hydrolase